MVPAADGDDGYSVEVSVDQFVEYLPMRPKEIVARHTIEDDRVTRVVLAIVPACPSVKPHTPDDCSTPDPVTQVIHIHARTDLILQRLRAVS